MLKPTVRYFEEKSKNLKKYYVYIKICNDMKGENTNVKQKLSSLPNINKTSPS